MPQIAPVGQTVFVDKSVRQFAVFVHTAELFGVLHWMDDGDRRLVVSQQVAAFRQLFGFVSELVEQCSP